MSRLLQFVLVAALAAVVGHLATIHALPSVIMSVAMSRISEAAVETAERRLAEGSADRLDLYRAVADRGGVNVAIAAPRADHTQRFVVRSSADLLYSACVFDLSKGPLRVTAPLAGGYASISGFAANTDNFFVLDDRRSDGERLSAVLHRPGEPTPKSVEGVGVASPTEKGVVLVRYLIEDESRMAEVLARQYEIACDPL